MWEKCEPSFIIIPCLTYAHVYMYLTYNWWGPVPSTDNNRFLCLMCFLSEYGYVFKYIYVTYPK